MSTEKSFQISLDPGLIIIERVYDAINYKSNLTMLINKDINKTNKGYKFRCICAIMDRMSDTVKYLEDIKLAPDCKKRHAFDFCDFINNAYVLVDCIDILSEIFDYDLVEENSRCDIFKKVRDEYGGKDCTYFKHLRSICSVHPANTSFYKKYFKGTFACSPFVEWRCETGDPNQLYVWIYENELENKNKFSIRDEGINIYEIFEYINYKYSILYKLPLYIKKKQKDLLNELKNKEIKKKNKFNNYVGYLENLKKEEEERFSDDGFSGLEFAIKYFKLNLSSASNKKLYKKYAEALKYAIKFKYNELQNMSCEGFKNCGIKDNDSSIAETTLLYELIHLHNLGEIKSKYSVEIQKTLEGLEPTNPNYPYNLREHFENSKPFFEKYVSFENVVDNFEFIALIRMALYQDCLENDCVVNRNIPNDLKYRFKLL